MPRKKYGLIRAPKDIDPALRKALEHLQSNFEKLGIGIWHVPDKDNSKSSKWFLMKDLPKSRWENPDKERFMITGDLRSRYAYMAILHEIGHTLMYHAAKAQGMKYEYLHKFSKSKFSRFGEELLAWAWAVRFHQILVREGKAVKIDWEEAQEFILGCLKTHI